MGPKRSPDHPCSYCSKTYRSKIALHAHIQSQHLNEKPFKCQHCKYSSVLKAQVNQHENRIHTKKVKFKCPDPDCEFENYCRSSLRQHVSGHKPKKKRFKCPECPVLLSSKDTLTRHMRIHTGERPFSCDLCDYKAKRKAHITAHLLTHTGEKPHQCPHCDYSSATKSPLTVHIKSVHDRKYSYICDVQDCKFKATSSSTLRGHKIRMHVESIKNRRCSFCEKTFWRNAELEAHLRTHTGEKPYMCDLCPYSSNQLSNLKTHAAYVHKKKEKGFECEVCDYSCHFQWELIGHQQRRHSESKPFKCEQCDYTAKWKNYLRLHRRMHLKEASS